MHGGGFPLPLRGYSSIGMQNWNPKSECPLDSPTAGYRWRDPLVSALARTLQARREELLWDFQRHARGLGSTDHTPRKDDADVDER